MKKHTMAVLSGVALIATIVALNTLGAAALPVGGADRDTRLVGERGSPDPTSTPVAPVVDGSGLLRRLPSGWTSARTLNSSPLPGTARQLFPETNSRTGQVLDRANVLRQPGARIRVPKAAAYASAGGWQQSAATEMCADVLLNPQLDVVEFGDGTGSIDYWSILYQQIYHDTRAGYYNSPYYSLALVDETPEDAYKDSDLVVIDDVVWDYDEFAQGFYVPPSVTSIRVHFSNLHANTDSWDSTQSYLWTLTPDGYLDDWVAYVDIPEGSEWKSWYWDLPSAKIPDVAGRLLAATFEMLSDRAAPYEVVWLDDLQVTVCFEVGQYGIYLPLLVKQPPAPSQPTCSPREPDSLSQPGSTTVGAACGGSFSSVDEKDYYTLDLKGQQKVRLRLYSLPPDTNWDALIYENVAGYPLACQIGTPGSGDKSANCTLELSKAYFVLVSRGPNRTGGSYGMAVEAR